MDILLIIVIVIAAIVALKLLSMLFSITGKVLIILLVVLIAYAVFAHAAKEEVFSGYVFSDQSITVDEKPFIIRYDPATHPSQIQVNHYEKFYFIPLRQCKTITNVDFCFANSIYDTYYAKVKVNISVYKVEPDITISRRINNSRLNVGDTALITTKISNNIGIPAENFEFTDFFNSNEFKLIKVSGDCSKEENNVIYRGSLREQDYKNCEYEIKALKEVEKSSKAKITYYDGTDIITKFSTAISFIVSPSFMINSYFNETDNRLFEGSKVLYIINMTNKNKEEDVKELELNISIPSSLRYKKVGSIKVRLNETSTKTQSSQSVEEIYPGLLRYRGFVNANTSRFIILELETIAAGISDIFLNGAFRLEEEILNINKKDGLEVKHKEITVFTNFEDNENFDSGQQKLIKIGISNPNDNLPLKNINITIITNISNFTGASVNYIDPLESLFILNQNINIPSVDRDKVYPFDININYETIDGIKYQEKFEYDLRVKSIGGLAITQSLSDSSVESGEEFSVLVEIENKRNVDLKNIRVFDVVPSEFQRIGLNLVSNLNINARDTVSVYQYKMIAPEVAVSTQYSFRTNAQYEENGKMYGFEKIYRVTVVPKKLDLSITRIISDSPILKGAILDVLYTITNNDNKKTIKDINIIFPVQQDIDLIGDKNFSIEQLLPGESYTIRDAHRIRPKLNDTLDLAPTLFFYKDELRNSFNDNSSKITFKAKDGFISGPAFIVSKDSNETVTLGDMITAKIFVQNIGDETGEVEINDNGNIWKLTVAPYETEIISYKINTEKAGKITFNPAFIKYYYNRKPVYTVSNSVYTTIINKKGEEPQPQQVISEPKSEEIKEIQVETVKKVSEEKTFFNTIWDAIKTILKVFGGS